ncbi:MAG: hybrid sensor histidine kinase/response regulator [Deltaproteobacteria bacterium]|nr:hybrid sensor histidine kinase/response regulator [Deltaproteobacteria bacterium]
MKHNVAVALTEYTVPAPGAAPEKPKLLLVDDEPHVLEGLALHLRRRYQIVTRTSAEAGLAALADEGPFTAVVSDLRMPGMDGVSFLTNVRERSPETSRLLLTGHGDLEAAVAAVNEAKVHRFLTKPCPPGRLSTALEEAIAETQSARSTTEMTEQVAAVARQATLGSLAGSIGHEVGNLVAALGGSLDLVREQLARGEMPASEDLGLLDLLRLRLGDHARQLTSLSRPRRMEIAPVDIVASLCVANSLLERAGMLRGARVELSVPAHALYVNADTGLFEAVIVNLMKNAAEALEAAAAEQASHLRVADLSLLRTSVIKVSAFVHEGKVRVVVEDNGPGIPPEQVRRLFDAYFTTKAEGRGTGLGLAIVKETIHRFGGTVEIESKLGVGTQVVIDLPSAQLR